MYANIDCQHTAESQIEGSLCTGESSSNAYKHTIAMRHTRTARQRPLQLAYRFWITGLSVDAIYHFVAFYTN